jgi:hypothetical protein
MSVFRTRNLNRNLTRSLSLFFVVERRTSKITIKITSTKRHYLSSSIQYPASGIRLTLHPSDPVVNSGEKEMNEE